MHATDFSKHPGLRTSSTTPKPRSCCINCYPLSALHCVHKYRLKNTRKPERSCSSPSWRTAHGFFGDDKNTRPHSENHCCPHVSSPETRTHTFIGGSTHQLDFLCVVSGFQQTNKQTEPRRNPMIFCRLLRAVSLHPTRS